MLHVATGRSLAWGVSLTVGLGLALALAACSDPGGPATVTGGGDEDASGIGFRGTDDATSGGQDAPTAEVVDDPADVMDAGPAGDVVAGPSDADATAEVDAAPPMTFGSIEGVVWFSNGDVAPGVPIQVLGEALDGSDIETDDQGFFTISDVAVGDRQVLAGPTAGSQAAVVTVTVTEGATANAGVIVLAETGGIEGVVFARDLPAGDQSGAAVSVPALGLAATSGPTGLFSLIGVPPYCAEVHFFRSGWQLEVRTVCVAPGVSEDVGTVELWLLGTCKPDCTDLACGDDGCGGSCGQCPDAQPCEAGVCVVGGECGDGQCEGDLGETCVTCAADCPCEGAAVCTEGFGCCAPSCEGATCGDDGCGGSCGECQPPLECDGSHCVLQGGTCGNGLCTAGNLEDCNTCAVDCGCGDVHVCLISGDCCMPQCDGKICGDDSCEGSCGTCPAGECVEGQCIFICPEELPEPALVAGPLPTIDPPGAVETVTKSGFEDVYLFDAGGSSKVGVRHEWGGSIVYFGPSDGEAGLTASNRIDTTNGQRGIRISLHDPDLAWQGCAAAATCVDPDTQICAQLPPFVGWNPRLGANECGAVPELELALAVPSFVSTSTFPLHSNPDWAAPDCSNQACVTPGSEALASDMRYTQQVRFVDEGLAEVRMSVQSVTSTHHPEAVHELPALFGAAGSMGTGTYGVVVDGDQEVVAVDSAQPDGTMTAAFSSPGGWAGLFAADLETGVAIAYDNEMSTFGASVGPSGATEVHGAASFDIPAGHLIETRAYLMYGSPAEIDARVAELHDALPPFGELEAPDADAALSATIAVSGWVLDNRGVVGLELLIDGEPVPTSRIDLAHERPDVCSRWPGYAGCGVQGFSGGASPVGLSPCAHIVAVRATDTDGNVRVIDEVRVTLGPGAACDVDAPESCEDGDPCTVDGCDFLLGCVGGPKPAAQLTGEFCNSLDDDCDGATDEAPADGCIDYYEDQDADAFGTGAAQCLCTPAAPFVAVVGGDCHDDLAFAHPFAEETCNGYDDDCQGGADPGDLCPAGQLPISGFLGGEPGKPDHAVDEPPASPGASYIYQGVAFMVLAASGPGLVPLYQSYSTGFTDHQLHISVAAPEPGYANPNLLGHCASESSEEAPNALRRYFSPATGDHAATTSDAEAAALEGQGYELEEVLCYTP